MGRVASKKSMPPLDRQNSAFSESGLRGYELRNCMAVSLTPKFLV